MSEKAISIFVPRKSLKSKSNFGLRKIFSKIKISKNIYSNYQILDDPNVPLFSASLLAYSKKLDE